MADYIKDLQTAIFTGPTDCGKSRLILDLIEKEFRLHHHYLCNAPMQKNT